MDPLDHAEQQEPFSLTVGLLLDSAAFARANALHGQLEALRASLALGRTPEGCDEDITEVSPVERAQQIAREMHDLHAEHPETLFRFQAVDPFTWSDLAAKHGADPEVFWPHALAASCVEPRVYDVEEWSRWRTALTPGQWNALRNVCQQTNEGLFDLTPT